ncbi:MAG: ABC transporter permease [Terriglobia bacterium]
MGKVWLVIRREYLTRVLTKGFVISTVAVPALLIGLVVFQFAAARNEPARTVTLSIVDQRGGLAGWIKSALGQDRLRDGVPAFRVTELFERPGDPGGLRSKLTALIQRGELGGFLWIPPRGEEGFRPELIVGNPGAFLAMDAVDRAVEEATLAAHLAGRASSPADISKLLRPARVRLIRLTVTGESEEHDQDYAVPIIMATLLYASLLMYGVTTMRSVLEEKTTRIVEILVSSLRPGQLLAGKILGVAAVGLTQFMVWVISAGLAAFYWAEAQRGLPGAAGVTASAGGFGITPAMLGYLVLYFTGGYFLFAAIYAAIGAVVSNEQDAQQIQMPVSLLLVGSFLLFGVILQDPNSPWAVGLSMIPFFSPVLMAIRISLQTPPAWQIGLSLGLLLLTTLGVIWASARIYTAGILMYGKRPSVAEVVRWLRAS